MTDLTPDMNRQARTMFDQILDRYRQRLAQLRADPRAKPSDILYVEKCIKNFEEVIARIPKPE